MENKRLCGYCGGTGHDARNCPAKKANSPKDQVVWYKVSDLTENQATKMTDGFIKLKNKVAPDAQGTYVKADKKNLPERIFNALGLNKED